MVIHKITNFGSSSSLVIPAAYLRKMGIARGSYVSLALIENNILIVAPIEKQALLATIGIINNHGKNETRRTTD